MGKEFGMVDRERILEELVAIGLSKVTDYLFVEDGVLNVRQTECLNDSQKAAIASIEKSGGSLKIKFYDKLKALELVGKYLGMFEGKSGTQVEENNLLQAILAATREEMNCDDLQEIQQAAAAGHDLVEQTQAEKF